MAVRREEVAAQTGARPGQGRDTGRSLHREEVVMEGGREVLGVEEHGQLLHQVGHHVPAVGGEAGDVLEVGEHAGQRPGAALGVDQEGGHQLPHSLLLQPEHVSVSSWQHTWHPKTLKPTLPPYWQNKKLGKKQNGIFLRKYI